MNTCEVADKQTSTELSVCLSLTGHSHQANILQFTTDLGVEERQASELRVLTFLCKRISTVAFLYLP